MKPNGVVKFSSQSKVRQNFWNIAGISEQQELLHAEDRERIPAGYGRVYFGGNNSLTESGLSDVNNSVNCCGGGGAGGSEPDSPVEPPEKQGGGGGGCSAVPIQELQDLVDNSSSFCSEDEEAKTLYVPALEGSDKKVNIISSCHADLQCNKPLNWSYYNFEAGWRPDSSNVMGSTGVKGGGIGDLSNKPPVTMEQFKQKALSKLSIEGSFFGDSLGYVIDFVNSWQANHTQLNCERCFKENMAKDGLDIPDLPNSFMRAFFDYVYTEANDQEDKLIYNYTTLFESSCDAGRRCINIDGFELRADGTYITVKTPSGGEVLINSISGIAVMSKKSQNDT